MAEKYNRNIEHLVHGSFPETLLLTRFKNILDIPLIHRD